MGSNKVDSIDKEYAAYCPDEWRCPACTRVRRGIQKASAGETPRVLWLFCNDRECPDCSMVFVYVN